MKRSLCLLEAKHLLVYDCLLKDNTCLYGRILLRVLKCYHDGGKELCVSLLTVKNCVGKALLYQVKDCAFIFLPSLQRVHEHFSISALASFCVTMAPCCLKGGCSGSSG